MTHAPVTAPAVRRRPWQIILVGVAVAALANVIVFALGTLAGASFVLHNDPAVPHAVGLVDVLVTSVVPLALGTGLAVVLQRWWRHALLAGQIVGGGLAVLSAAGPAAAVTDTATVVSLVIMHVLVGVAVVAILAPLRARGV
jgi:Family of unknown function (DUF6069)